MLVKECSVCKIIQPIDNFYKDKTHKGGYGNWCKLCFKIHNQKYWIENKERASKVSKEWRTKNAEYCKLYRDNKSDELKRYSQEYKKNNKEKIKESNREYRETNIVYEKKRIREWFKNNPEKRRGYGAFRRALIRGIMTEKIDILKVFINHNWVCGICGKKINKKLKHPNPMSVSLDHITPLTRGGNHVENNTQPAHLVCNERKCNNINNIQLKL